MATSTPRIGVVTVTYNSGDVLPDFLDSMAAQRGVEVYLYVIDNDSKDQTANLVRAEGRIPNLKAVFNDGNLGVAVGNNQGIELALEDDCDWVLLLNNDTIVPSDALIKLVDTAEANGIDLLSPTIEATEPPGTIWYGGGRFVPFQGYRTLHDAPGRPVAEFPRELTETGYASTCCLLVRPSVIERVGLMDPVYFVYFDDVDFAVRCTKAGYKYWVSPVTTIVHKASSLTGGKSSPFTVRWVSRNWPLIARRHLGPVAGPVALAYIQLWMLARLVARRDSPQIYRIRQKSFREGVKAAGAPPAPRLSVSSSK
jgi:GT2 family glycosyltransferase